MTELYEALVEHADCAGYVEAIDTARKWQMAVECMIEVSRNPQELTLLEVNKQIQDVIRYLLSEQLRYLAPDLSNLRHPEYSHLVFIDAWPHHSMYQVTCGADNVLHKMLVNEEDLRVMLGDQYREDEAEQFGYVSDEYLEQMTEA